ncbi:MAG: response regulator [Chloroflexi bacterium]|nr:response regulator [Chloroflexota bacterium]
MCTARAVGIPPLITPHMLMLETSSFIAAATFVAAVVALVMTPLLWNRRQAPGAVSVVWLMIAAAVWSGGYGIEVLLDGLDDKLLLVPVQYVGITTVPVFWFITAAQLTGRIRTFTPRLLTVMLIVPAVTVILTVTNSSHNLMWSDAFIVGEPGSLSLEFIRGTWFWISFVYSYIAFFAGFGFLLYRAFAETSMFRGQMIAAIVAGTIPLGANLLFVTELSPLGVFDPTPMSFAASGAIIAFSYIRFKLFDLVPIAVDILVERIPDAMFVLDSEGHIVDANPAAERMIARGGKGLIGRHLCDALPGNLAVDHELCSRSPAAVNRDVVIEDPTTLKPVVYSPTVTALSDNASDARDTKNTGDTRGKGPGGRLVILRDVTEQRKASETLRRLARITTVNAITTDVAAVHDVESIMDTATSRLADLLPAAHACGLLLDPDSGEFVVVNVAGPHEPPPLRLNSRTIDSVILTPGPFGGDHDLSNVAGRLDDFAYRFAASGLHSVVGHTLSANGETYGAIIVARADAGSLGPAEVELMNAVGASVAQAIYGARLVDDLRSMNMELVESRQQIMRQERLKALGQMAGGIAHDINNALSPVVGFSDMLLQQSTDLDDHSKKLLQLIRLGALDISRIVERMRQLYRNREANEIEVEPVDIRQIVRETIELTRPRWRDRSGNGGEIRISTDFARVLPQIPGVDTEIREALTNLVLNSVDAMPDGGRIVIAGYVLPEPANGDEASQPEQVIIDVIDEGSGMTPETAQRAMEPFFTTKGEGGTGLGLPMVQQVMQHHAGSVSIHAREKIGTIVRLSFPVEASTAYHRTRVTDDESIALELKVLVVDDEPMLRMVVEEMLSAEGHLVTVAVGGPEASELVSQAYKSGDPFDVVVSDIEMPVLNGRMLAEFIESESPDTDVILMTGWTDRQIDVETISTRVVGLLKKPPRLADITALLAVVARNAAPATPPAEGAGG